MKHALYLSVFFGFFVLPSWLSCFQPLPPAPPGPTPDDPYAGAIVDCGGVDVEAQAATATTAVRDCLLSTAATVCLASLYPQYTVATVACVVRDMGVIANQRMLADQAEADDVVIDSTARDWIVDKRLGYRSVQR